MPKMNTGKHAIPATAIALACTILAGCCKCSETRQTVEMLKRIDKLEKQVKKLDNEIHQAKRYSPSTRRGAGASTPSGETKRPRKRTDEMTPEERKARDAQKAQRAAQRRAAMDAALKARSNLPAAGGPAPTTPTTGSQDAPTAPVNP